LKLKSQKGNEMENNDTPAYAMSLTYANKNHATTGQKELSRLGFFTKVVKVGLKKKNSGYKLFWWRDDMKDMLAIINNVKLKGEEEK